MALAWTTDTQARVALMVCGKPYAECPPSFRALLDADGSVGQEPSGGVALDAFRTVTGYAQWFELAGAGAASQAAEAYLIAECAYRMSIVHNSEKTAIFERMLERSKEDYFASVTRMALQDGFDSGVASLTLRDLRYHVVSSAIRRRPRIFPAAETIDAAAVYVSNRIWNACRWLSKSRVVRATIRTDETVEWDLANGEDFDDFATTVMYLQQNEDGARVQGTIQLVDQESMSRMIADRPDEVGTPRFFRMNRESGMVVWKFYPAPDTNYVVTCEVGVTGPGSPVGAGSTGPFLRFPETFHALVREWTLAKVLADHGQPDGFAKARSCEDDLARLAVSQEDRGVPDTIVDVASTSSSFFLPEEYGFLGGPL